jgi:hypothetical protein
MLVQTLGYYTAGDGGGLAFRYVAASAAATNYGTIIKPSNAGRFVWIGGPNISINSFGAIADATTDYSTQIQAALDYGASSGVPIYVPSAAGSSYIAQNLILNGFVTLLGDNDPKSLNTAETGVKSVIRRKSGGSNTPLLSVASGIQCSINGLAFDGDWFNNVANTNAVLDFLGYTYDKRDIRNVSVRYATAYGIKIASSELTLNNVAVFDGSGVGIYLRGQDSFFESILVGRNAGDGIVIDNLTGAASTQRWNNIDSFQNQGYGVNSIIPYFGTYNKIICNNNCKGGWLVDCQTLGISSQRLSWFNCFFQDNNYPIYPYFATRGVLTYPNSIEPTATYSNFEVTGPGTCLNGIWNSVYFTGVETSSAKRPKYGFNWSVTGNANGYSSTFINCLGNNGAPVSGLTYPATLFSSVNVNALGSGNTGAFTYDGSTMNDFRSGRDLAVTRNGTIGGTLGVTGNGNFENALNVGDGTQTGSSSTPTLSVTHNTTVSTFLKSIISGQPTIGIQNLGSAAFAVRDESNGRIGMSMIMGSARTDLVLGGIGPGPARSAFVRAPDSLTGTNNAGSDLTIYPGRGTGSGTPGYYVVQVPVTGSTGTTQQSLTSLIVGGDFGLVLGLGQTGSTFKRVRFGRAPAMVGGVIAVSDAYVTANTRIILTVYTVGGTQGFLNTGTRTASTSFTITSSSALDTSVVDWVSFEP